ncbi:MAG TPA: ABC transporter permease, partial [Gemmatimonadales bacterium]
MNALRRARAGLLRLLGLRTRSADDARMTEEMRFHLDRLTDRYMKEGFPPDEARRRAAIEFGGIVKHTEASRDQRRSRVLENTIGDLRYAARGLMRSPGFTIAAVLMLGLGIGANATMFGIVDRLLFRPPAYMVNADRVHRVYFASTYSHIESFDASTSWRRYQDLQRWTHSFDLIAEFMHPQMAIGTGEDTQVREVLGATANYWALFDVKPALGRFFTEDENRVPLGTPVAVLTYDFWRSRFAGQNDVLGKQLRIGQRDYTIIGVAPRDFAGTSMVRPVAIIPLISTLYDLGRKIERLDQYNWGWPELLVRLRPGVTHTAADQDLTAAFRLSWQEQYKLNPANAPVELARPRVITGGVLEDQAPAEARGSSAATAQVALWLIGVAAIVLIIACANVGNLLLARAFGRRREIAVRLALGIGRRRLLAQLLTESLLLAGLGAGAGLAIAQWGGQVLRAALLPNVDWPATLSDGRVLAFATTAALVAGLGAGLAPAAFARRTNIAGALKAGVREGTFHRSRLRTGLLLVQGALSVTLLVGAGLFVKSFQSASGVRLGYDADHLVFVERNLRGARRTLAEQNAIDEQLNRLARTVPGVAQSSRATSIPLRSFWSLDFFIPGIDTAFINHLRNVDVQAGSPSYFETVGTPIVRGRGFTDADDATAPMVVVVSASFATTMWKGHDAIGQCLKIDADTNPCRTVVGVAQDAVYHSLSNDAGLAYYLPIQQWTR